MLLIALIVICIDARAQLSPLTAQYYNNQYITNPAYAGIDQGMKLNFTYRKLWNNIPGVPQTQNLTADYGFQRVGIGLQFNNESAGLIRQINLQGTYAYHLPLNSGYQRLHFGVSLVLMNQRLQNSGIIGDVNDPLVGLFNARKTYVDGTVGVAYTSRHLNAQVSLPNLRTLLDKSEIKLADVNTFYSAVSYKITRDEIDRIDIEPKITFRGIKGLSAIWDAGVQVGIADHQFSLITIYHSTQCVTLGFGLDYQKKYLISGSYTTPTSAISNYTNGIFELNLRIALPDKF